MRTCLTDDTDTFAPLQRIQELKTPKLTTLIDVEKFFPIDVSCSYEYLSV